MEKEFTLIVHSENHPGLLNQVVSVFTRRNMNIESVNSSESALAGIHKLTFVVNTTPEEIQKIVGQLEKKIDILKVFVLTTDEIIHQEMAMYKVPTEPLLNSNEIEELVRQHGARIVEITPEYTVIEKTGHKSETQDLFVKLDKYHVLQFIRTGRIAVTKSRREFLQSYLDLLRSENEVLQSKPNEENK